MKKTLWLGCSHSAGIYSYDDIMTSDRGLPFVVGKNYGLDNWKAIASPGQGIIEFNNILENLDRRDLLDFDNLILQLTHEPRLCAFNSIGEALKNNSVEKYIKLNTDERKIFVYRNDIDYSHEKQFGMAFNRHPVSLYKMYCDTFPNDSKSKDALLNMCETISYSLGKHIKPLVRTCFKNITEITERRGIKLYTFSWKGISTYEHLDKLDYLKYDISGDKGIMDRLDAHPKIFCTSDTNHPTEDGVEVAGSLITEMLNTHGFEG